LSLGSGHKMGTLTNDNNNRDYTQRFEPLGKLRYIKLNIIIYIYIKSEQM
jgi:hypothetical protein